MKHDLSNFIDLFYYFNYFFFDIIFEIFRKYPVLYKYYTIKWDFIAKS